MPINLNITPTQVTIVTGAPCSGKSTYVRERRGPNDLVIDLDDIRCALGSHGHDEKCPRFPAALEARNAVIGKLNRSGYPHSVWYIACEAPLGNPSFLRSKVTRVRLAATEEECKRRALASRPPHWQNLIEEYFRKYP